MAKRELQFDDGKSRKFWTILLEGTSHTVTFGRIGTAGQTRTKEFDTVEEARRSYDKLVAEKIGKGYVDAEGTERQPPAGKPTDENATEAVPARETAKGTKPPTRATRQTDRVERRSGEVPSDLPGILRALAAVQRDLRELVPDAGASSAPPSSSRPAFDRFTDLVTGMGQALGGATLGSRLLHWDPELVDFRAKVLYRGEPAEFIVYQPLDIRIGGRPHIFFEKLHKIQYGRPAHPSSDQAIVERQFGITYSGWQGKRKLAPILDAFKRGAAEAGALIASAKEWLGALLPAETLATKKDFHRWIFTVYDAAWRAAPKSPLAATKYIPFKGFDEYMRTDEFLRYDLDFLRSTPWSEVERRVDPNRWGYAVHLEGPYASWKSELPEYYASRIDDIVQASVWTIDWLIQELQGAEREAR